MNDQISRQTVFDKPKACTDCKCGECRKCCTSEGKGGKGITHKENIKAILECYFTGFKEEIIDSACNRIIEQESSETIHGSPYDGTRKPQQPFDEYGNYKYPSDVELAVPNTATSIPCGDAISRQAVLDYIYNDLRLGDEEIGNDVERQMELYRSYKYVKSLPPVNPQPKMGYWVDREVYDADRWKCSECGRTEPYKENFCPNCGARMVEERSGEV